MDDHNNLRRQRGKLHEQYDNKDNKARKGDSDTRDGGHVYDNEDNYIDAKVFG